MADVAPLLPDGTRDKGANWKTAAVIGFAENPARCDMFAYPACDAAYTFRGYVYADDDLAYTAETAATVTEASPKHQEATDYGSGPNAGDTWLAVGETVVETAHEWSTTENDGDTSPWGDYTVRHGDRVQYISTHAGWKDVVNYSYVYTRHVNRDAEGPPRAWWFDEITYFVVVSGGAKTETELGRREYRAIVPHWDSGGGYHPGSSATTGHLWQQNGSFPEGVAYEIAGVLHHVYTLSFYDYAAGKHVWRMYHNAAGTLTTKEYPAVPADNWLFPLGVQIDGQDAYFCADGTTNPAQLIMIE